MDPFAQEVGDSGAPLGHAMHESRCWSLWGFDDVLTEGRCAKRNVSTSPRMCAVQLYNLSSHSEYIQA